MSKFEHVGVNPCGQIALCLSHLGVLLLFLKLKEQTHLQACLSSLHELKRFPDGHNFLTLQFVSLPVGNLKLDVEQYAELTLNIVLELFVQPGPERSFKNPNLDPQIGIFPLLQIGLPALHVIEPFEQNGEAFGRAQNWAIGELQPGLPLHGSIVIQISPFLHVVFPH